MYIHTILIILVINMPLCDKKKNVMKFPKFLFTINAFKELNTCEVYAALDALPGKMHPAQFPF